MKNAHNLILIRIELASGQFQDLDTIAQHGEIHLEYYLNVKCSQFKSKTGLNMILDNSKI